MDYKKWLKDMRRLLESQKSLEWSYSAAFATEAIPRGAYVKRYGRPVVRTSLRRRDRKRGSEIINV